MTDEPILEDPGESVSRSGEDIAEQEDEEGRDHLGTKGASDRPVGTSTARDSTGVNPQEPITDSPMQPTGDQGG